MSRRPWYGLAPHRPPGPISRVRRDADEGPGRHDVKATAEEDPASLTQVPD